MKFAFKTDSQEWEVNEDGAVRTDQEDEPLLREVQTFD